MRLHAKQIGWVCAVVLLSSGWAASSGLAQVEIDAEAIAGEPFGVGRLTVVVPAAMQPEVLGVDGLGLDEEDGRVLYPAIDKKVFLGLLRDILDRPQKATIYFLFRGDGPLKMSLRSRGIDGGTVTPRRDPAAHGLLLAEWWEHYTARPKLLERAVDYPPLVENYLTSLLARRMNLRLPFRRQTAPWQARLEREVGLQLDTESIRVAMQQDRLLELTALGEVAEGPLPQPIAPEPLITPEPPADVKVEPLALRVPAECFYMRFGSFSNFLWFQDTLARWEGDLRNLLARRGLNYEHSRRAEEQLALHQTVLARLLGDTLVADAAIVGTDLFLHEGAAIGIMFHARNNMLLATTIAGQRAEAMEKNDAVTEQKIKIDGHEVSFLSSPDNSVRSFYVADDDYHFVTTSKELAKRFLATGSGGALGSSKEFRHARALMPLEREDTAFIYFSDAFFRNMVSPQYRVEMARRLQAVADVELVQLAMLASAAEERAGESIEQLSNSGFLPRDFQLRPDGSHVVVKDGEVHDSLRGRRGSFLPVPDVKITKITPSEAAAYRRFADYYYSRWGRKDPMTIGIKRHELPEDRERVVLDVHMSPLSKAHFDILSQWVGPPDDVQLAPVTGNMGSVEFALRKGRLFGGLQDINPPIRVIAGQILPFGRLRDIMIGYVGAAGELGMLSILDSRIPPGQDPAGYACSPLGLWRRRIGPFTVFSHRQDVLAHATEQLRLVKAQESGQLRLNVGNVSRSQLTPLLSSMGYVRTRETSLGNVRLMHSLNQQLHVPEEDCREAAEVLLDGTLVCPLGGEYVCKKTADGVNWWTSDGLESVCEGGLLTTQPPEGYQAPPLDWFRGMELVGSMTPEEVYLHAEIVMQLSAEE